VAIWQHYKRVLGIFHCACAETAIKQLPVKNLTLPFAPATSISYKTDVFPLPSGVYRIYSMFLCYNVERFCDLGHWPSDLLMPDPHTNFDYSTTIGYWVTITEFDHITVIWNSHCACAVSRDLSPGGNGPYFVEISDPNLLIYGGRRGSVVRTSVFNWRTFPDYTWSTVDMWPLRG